MLSVALAKPLIKTTGKERLKEEPRSIPPGTLSDSLHSGEGTASGSHSPKFPEVLVPTASTSHRHTVPGASPKPGKGTKAGNPQWTLMVIRLKGSF